jgi:hypothetical protein
MAVGRGRFEGWSLHNKGYCCKQQATSTKDLQVM